MLYNVAQLLQEDPGTTRHYEVHEAPITLDEGLEVVEPIDGHLKLTRMNRGILAEAKVDTTVQLECSRCLEDVRTPISLQFVEEYYPTVDLRTGIPTALPEGGSGFMLTEAHELDLSEPIRQFALLAMPMKPLCQPDCAGLCPTCGKDRNKDQCSCVAEPADPRLAELAKWLRTDRE